MSNKYYEVVAKNEAGELEVLFGSFERDDCKSEIECERHTWKEQGYKNIRVTSRDTNESPDPEVYGDKDYKKTILNALFYKGVSVSVKDNSECFYDVENSTDINEIFSAIEATDEPIVEFFDRSTCLGFMQVIIEGDNDECIANYSDNAFMNKIIE